MAEMWKPHSIDTYKHWVVDILTEASNELNDWESNFVSNIDNQLDADRQLSEAQADKLEQIYVKHVK